MNTKEMKLTAVRWWPNLRQFAAAVALAGAGLSCGIWSLKAAGVAPLMFPGDRLVAIEDHAMQVDSVQLAQHVVLTPLPDRVARLERDVDSLKVAGQAAARERMALLYIACYQHRATFPMAPVPLICSTPDVRRVQR